MKKTGILWISFGLLLVSGCVTGGGDQAGMAIPEGIPSQPAAALDYKVDQPKEGSLWTETNRSMFADKKASFVGDTVIVDIVESSSSSMDVNTETSKTTSMDVGTSVNLFGLNTQFGGTGGTSGNLDTNFANSFQGEAESDRSGQVTASIAARITEILPNGNLSLFGRRAMKVDHEVQYIVVSGVVRPNDIDADNRVESTYLADARIEYYGKGALADKQKPGWGTRLIDNLWPF